MINKILRKLTSTDKATLTFGLCAVLQKMSPFLLMPFLTRGLSPDEYGLYTVYQSWIVIITVFATLNLHLGGFNNGLLRYSDRRIDYTVSIVSLCAVFSCILLSTWSFLTIGLHWTIIDMQPRYVILLFIQIICGQGFFCWAAKARYEHALLRLVTLTAISTFFSIFFPLVLLFCHESVFMIILGVQLPGMIIGLGCFLTYLRKNKWKINTYYWKKTLAFNFPLLPHYISSVILGQIDRIMIQNICGMEKVALYSVAYNLSNAMSVLINSFNAAIVPDIYEALKRNDTQAVSEQMKKYVRYFAFAILGMMLILPEVISIMAPDNYRSAILVVPPIAMSSFFILVYCIYANVEFYYESKWFISFSSALAAILNVVLNAIFIPVFGYYAAAYTTLVCYILYAFAHMNNARRLIRSHDNQPLLPNSVIVKTTIFLGICTMFIYFIYPYVIVRYLVLCIFSTLTILIYMRRKSVC